MNHFLSSPDDTYRPRSPAAVTAVAWAPDGSAAVSGNQAGELTLWQEAKAVVTVQVSGVNFSFITILRGGNPCIARGELLIRMPPKFESQSHHLVVR